MNEVSTAETLRSGKCVPCEGGVPGLEGDDVIRQLAELDGWELRTDPDRIAKSWTVKNFIAGIRFFEEVTQVAEEEGHHPDLHLEGYRNARIEIWTHAIRGLSLNDFILAAKIDQLPVDLK